MPDDVEIHFGVQGYDAVRKLMTDLGGHLVNGDTGKELAFSRHTFEQVEKQGLCVDLILPQTVQQALDQIFVTCVRRIWNTEPERTPKKHWALNTPHGSRESQGLEVFLLFDPVEIGDQIDNMSLGVALTRRYRPGLLDIPNFHGTVHNIPLRTDQMAICQQEIETSLPAFTENKATFFIRARFY